MGDDLIQRFRAELAVLKGAPVSAVVIAAISACAGFAFCKVVDAGQINGLIAQRDLFKEQIDAPTPSKRPEGLTDLSNPPPASGVLPNDGGPRPELTGISFEDIRRAYEGRTTAEGLRLVAPYLGRPATAAGKISDVHPGITGQRSYIVLSAPLDYRVSLAFDGPHLNDPLTLHIGDSIKAACTIEGVEFGNLRLGSCILQPQSGDP